MAAQAHLAGVDSRVLGPAQVGVADGSAPVGGWRRAVGDCTLVSAATVLCQMITACTSLLLRVFLSPAEMGVWQAAKLWLGYANYANLGISKGAVREYNVALGREAAASAHRGLNIAFAVNTVSSILCAGLFAGAGIWWATKVEHGQRTDWAAAMLAVAGMAIFTRYSTFHVTILRAGQRFALCSHIALLEALLTLVVCGVGAWWFRLGGLCGGTLLVVIAVAAVVHRARAVDLRFDWHAGQARRLVVIGGPILLTGTLSTLFRSLDKLVILACLPNCAHQLGCYSLALLVGGQLYGLGNMVSIAMGPRYAQQFGRSGSRVSVARLAARSSELHAAVIGLAAGLALVLAPPLLGYLLPDYRQGLPSLAWLVPGTAALVLALPPSQYLIAVDRQNRAVTSLVAAVGLALLGNYAAVQAQWGLVGIAAATALAYAVYWVLVVLVSIWPELPGKERLRYVACTGLGTAAPIAAAFLVRPFEPLSATAWRQTAAKMLLVMIAWAAAVLVGWYAGWRRNPQRQ